MPIAAPDFYSNPSGSTLYAGRLSGVQPPAPPPGTVLTTLTMTNETGAAQPANLVSPMFGVPFRQGEIAAGDNPQFKLADGTACPATVWGKTTWPDGSLKFCAAMVRLPAAIAAGGTLAVQVQNGGVAPAPSLRTTADLTAADIKVELTGVTNLSGLWTASLNDAIASASDVTVIGSGAAGKIWRIGGDCKQAGAAHGQLYCWHYVAALTNSSGGLLGLRYLGRVAQPWADVSAPVATRRVVTAQLKTGSTVRRTFQGHDTSETLGANIGMDHYTSWFTADTNALWDYVQGGGSDVTDGVVRVKHDKVKVTRTKLVPPFDLTISVDSNSPTEYRPYARCFIQRAMGGTGERDDLGLMTSWSVRHFMTQAAVDETVIRAQGLVSAGWRTTARSQATKEIIPTYAPSSNYAGLGAPKTDWYFMISGDKYSGYVDPVVEQSLWSEDYETSHRPSTCYYTYLVTGEPQYLDLLVDMSAALLANSPAGTAQLNTTQPITLTNMYLAGTWAGRDVLINSVLYKGGGWLTQSFGPRAMAWGLRDLAQAAAIYPDVCPRGTETKKYFRDVVNASLNVMNVYNAAMGPEWNALGAYDFNRYPEYYSVWMDGYLSNTMCQVSSILPSSAATNFRKFLSQFWENLASSRDLAAGFTPHAALYDANGTRITNINNFLGQIGVNLSLSTSTNRATLTPGELGKVCAPTDGDVFLFPEKYGNNPFAPTYPYRTLFYAVNCSGQTMQMALTPGGPPVTIPTNASGLPIFARVANFSPYATAEYSGNSAIMANVCGCIRHHVACGDSIPTALADSNAKIALDGVTYTDDPKNAYVSAYPT